MWSPASGPSWAASGMEVCSALGAVREGCERQGALACGTGGKSAGCGLQRETVGPTALTVVISQSLASWEGLP